MGFLFISRMRQKQRLEFVVFRTDYTSDADWAKFLEMYKLWPQEVLEFEGAQRAALITSWEQMWWMDDRSKYENASIATLRESHRTWLAGLDDRRVLWPEQYMFLVVMPQRSPREQHRFVKVFDASA